MYLFECFISHTEVVVMWIVTFCELLWFQNKLCMKISWMVFLDQCWYDTIHSVKDHRHVTSVWYSGVYDMSPVYCACQWDDWLDTIYGTWLSVYHVSLLLPHPLYPQGFIAYTQINHSFAWMDPDYLAPWTCCFCSDCCIHRLRY